MARKYDSLWRDEKLVDWHTDRGHYIPAAGLPMPFIEYDSGVPVGLISYLADGMPIGAPAVAAHRSLGALNVDGSELPFFTVGYDLEPGHAPRYSLFAHNDAANELTDSQGVWLDLDEANFARTLYAMRGRFLPDLSRQGVTWGAPVQPIAGEMPFPGADMSIRRRNFEPAVMARHSLRIPCTDIDLMVPARDGRTGLLVDYKMDIARVDLKSTSLKALAGLCNTGGSEVPAMVVQYDRHWWTFSVYCLNPAANRHLAYVAGAEGWGTDLQASLVAGAGWTVLSEAQWLSVLEHAAH